MNYRKIERQRKNKLRKLSRPRYQPIRVSIAQSSSMTIQKLNRVHRDLVSQVAALAIGKDSAQMVDYVDYVKMGVPRLRVEVQRLLGGVAS